MTQPAAPGKPLNYIAGLDTVRGISMLLVMMTHLHLVGAGWVTIQTFFVMSGFLITRILLKMREGRSFGAYLKIFYARRTLRIFPVFYLCLLLCLIASFFVPSMADDRGQMGYAALYVWNWFAIFDTGPRAHYLEHFWSLAVEEQFYLAWPFLIYWLRGARFWQVSLAIVLAGPLLRGAAYAIWVWTDPGIADAHKALYQMSITHLDAFALGGLMCVVVQQGWSYRFAAWHWFVLVALAFAAGAAVNGFGVRPSGPYHVALSLGYPIHMENGWQFIWGYTVLNVVSAGLLLLVAQGRLWPKFFTHPFLARLGVITYGAYVFHLPLLHISVPWVKAAQAWVGSAYWGSMLMLPILMAIAFGAAELSFRYFESRILSLKDRLFPS